MPSVEERRRLGLSPDAASERGARADAPGLDLLPAASTCCPKSDGYALVKCDLAAFKPEGLSKKRATPMRRCRPGQYSSANSPTPGVEGRVARANAVPRDQPLNSGPIRGAQNFAPPPQAATRR